MVVVVVDSEAEFDWTAGAPRRPRGVTSVKSQLQVQSIFERYEVRPTYVLDYPVSSTPEAYEIIRELYRSGSCEIGAHLQPWDNPPFFERKTDENSYPGNLPFELERAKLARLTRIIQENVGVRPRIYKAGRFGVGRATAQILAELGFEIDLSVVPGTNLTRQFGPDFSHCGAHPYWFGKAPALLEIPLSVGRHLRRKDPQGRQSRGSAGSTTNDIRAGGQPQDRQRARPNCPAIDPGPRRRGH
jgi:hypothetical protein